jgi:hypothetical protein
LKIFSILESRIKDEDLAHPNVVDASSMFFKMSTTF